MVVLAGYVWAVCCTTCGSDPCATKARKILFLESLVEEEEDLDDYIGLAFQYGACSITFIEPLATSLLKTLKYLFIVRHPHLTLPGFTL